MAVDKARIGLVFILLVLLFSILALVYWDFVRDTIIIPIYYIIWVIGLILKSIPQGVYYAVVKYPVFEDKCLRRFGQRKRRAAS